MKPIRIAAVPLLLLSVLVVAQLLAAPPEVDIKKELAAYTHWAKVNERSPMDPVSALSCVYIAPRPPNDPHAKFYISVFVNDTGLKAMQKRIPGPFPAGSMIVKQKFREKNTSPELLTMMIKREPGFDPKFGNWEYLVATGDGKSIFGRGKLEQCQGCHVSMASQDYVYRNYSGTPIAVPLPQGH